MDLRNEIIERLTALTEGTSPPEDVSEWATSTMQGDLPELLDADIWQALDRLSGADLKSDPTTYLHSTEDYVEWLREFRDQ
ncbi:DNA-binding protein [Streptomyces rhizosphaericus]|uniref:DNA-binding protein n=1 Tax=Streptomyces rhizosphaericus TaxID=114699 RepID=A0A6G4ALV6_9ACTN|nr:DNA-binding protein [Streptomyces rhizosphaericus]NEW74222.1 DNA-binding protein [Streptomyces rhizosphaericus]